MILLIISNINRLNIHAEILKDPIIEDLIQYFKCNIIEFHLIKFNQNNINRIYKIIEGIEIKNLVRFPTLLLFWLFIP